MLSPKKANAGGISVTNSTEFSSLTNSEKLEQVNGTDLGRISIYDLNTDGIELSPSEQQLKDHTGYQEEHLRRLKYLFQQVAGPSKRTMDAAHFESAARSMCHSLTESSEAHHLAEILFKAYDKNTNGAIDFSEMVEFVWTVVDAQREEQIGGLYQAIRHPNGKLSRDRLIEFLTILKEDFQPKTSSKTGVSDQNLRERLRGQSKPLNTDVEIRDRVDECLRHYNNPSDGVDLGQVVNFFLGPEERVALKVKAGWSARLKRHDKKRIHPFSPLNPTNKDASKRQTTSSSPNIHVKTNK